MKSLKVENENCLISKKIERLLNVRIEFMPPCKMVSSGFGYFGMKNFDDFDHWFSGLPNQFTDKPKDFLWYDPTNQALVWWYIYDSSMGGLPFEIIDFEGGLYATAVSKDQDDEDGNIVYEAIKQWIAASDQFVIDENDDRHTMSHIITSQEAQKLIGFSQLEIWVPMKLK